MRIIFLGSGEFGLPTLRSLSGRHDVVAVVTQPDRQAGRKRQPAATPIAQWAQSQGLNVLKAVDVNEPEFVERVTALKSDAGVVIAFGQKLGQPLINATGRLTVNLHASLLPEYRGAAPINWAIIHGEAETGVSVISLAQRMDAGVIYGQAATRIDPLETAGELHDRLAKMGPDIIAKVLDDLAAGTLTGQEQDESKATKAPKLNKSDGTVDFDADAQDVRNRIHGLTPWPGVRVNWVRGEGGTAHRQPLILHRVTAKPDLSCFIGINQTGERPATGTVVEGSCVVVRDGVVGLLEVQVPGGRVMKIDEFVCGHHMPPGDRLESPRPSQ